MLFIHFVARIKHVWPGIIFLNRKYCLHFGTPLINMYLLLRRIFIFIREPSTFTLKLFFGVDEKLLKITFIVYDIQIFISVHILPIALGAETKFTLVSSVINEV